MLRLTAISRLVEKLARRCSKHLGVVNGGESSRTRRRPTPPLFLANRSGFATAAASTTGRLA
jgi:hypothetical protein